MQGKPFFPQIEMGEGVVLIFHLLTNYPRLYTRFQCGKTRAASNWEKFVQAF